MSDWRETREYRVWRATVISRDSKCQCCGSLKDRHAHHIQHATYAPTLRFEPANGVTLCAGCHSTLHNKLAGKNTLNACMPSGIISMPEHQINRLYDLWLNDHITDAEFVLWGRMLKDAEKRGDMFFQVPKALSPVAEKLYLSEFAGETRH